jgi:hypothetical protein
VRKLSFSSWRSVLATLLDIILVILLGAGIRLLT